MENKSAGKGFRRLDIFVIIGIVILGCIKLISILKLSEDAIEAFNIFPVPHFSLAAVAQACYTVMHQFLYVLIFSNELKSIIEFRVWTFLARAVSILFSSLSIYIFFKLSLRIFKKRAIAYLSVLFLSTHILFTFYSLRIESYAVFLFFSLLSYYYFWEAFILKKDRGIWKYCLATMACFLMHMLALQVIISQGLALVILWITKYRDGLVDLLRFVKALLIFNFLFILHIPAILLPINLYYSGASSGMRAGMLFYPEKDKLLYFTGHILKIIFGFAGDGSFYTAPFILLFLLYLVFHAKRPNPPFITLTISVFAIAIVYWCYFSYVLSRIGVAYFNVRHYIWLIPFVCLVYSRLIHEVIKSTVFYKRIIGYLFCLLVVPFNLISSGAIIINNMNPAYREAMAYIKQRLTPQDRVVWPTEWVNGAVYASYNAVFGRDPDVFFTSIVGSISPIQIAQRMNKNECLRVIVPYEDYLGIEHMRRNALLNYLGWLKHYFKQKDYWKGNKIEVYSFSNAE